MKKITLLIFSILSLGLTSAYGMSGGSFNNFSYIGLIQNFDAELIITAVIFLIFFTVLYKILDRVRMFNNNTVNIIISVIITLFGILALSKTNIDLPRIFFNFGLSENLIMTLAPWLLIAISIFVIIKKGIGKLLICLGAILFLVGAFGLVYEQGIAIFLGIIFFIIGLWLRQRRKTKEERMGLNLKRKEEMEKLKARGKYDRNIQRKGYIKNLPKKIWKKTKRTDYNYE